MEYVTLRSSDLEVVVVPAYGARLHSLKFRGHELLRSPADADQHASDPFFWGGYVMAPWCNRITPGLVAIGDRRVELVRNFDDGTALHGEVYAREWRRIADAAFVTAGGGSQWPWRYRVNVDYGVAGRELTVALRLTNLDDVAMPGGIGLHPWFSGRPLVRIDSDTVYPSNKASEALAVAVSGDFDLRGAVRMAEGVDATWPDLRDPPVELHWPSLALRATLTAPHPALHIVAAYAPERAATAVEPQTHAPEGLRRLLRSEPGALTWIEPGESLELPITLRFDDA